METAVVMPPQECMMLFANIARHTKTPILFVSLPLFPSLLYAVPQKITLSHNLHFKPLSNCFLTSFAQNLVFKQADLLFILFWYLQ